jgi:hypothetical protein
VFLFCPGYDIKLSQYSPTIAKEDLFMFEEDYILPDETVEETAPPQAEETPVEDSALPQAEEMTEDTQELDETTDTEDVTPQMLRVKFNKEEREIPLDEAVPLVQKGMNYDKLQEKLQSLESDPRLSFVEELAKEQGMDVNQYLDAVKQWKEQAKLDELVQQNIPEDVAKEMLENRKFRDQYENERKAKEEESKRNEEFKDFLSFFKEANDRDFDAQKDQIPQEVWQAHNSGIPLKYAYLEHHNNQLKSQLQTYKQNESNAKKAPVQSLTSYGNNETEAEDDFLKGFNSI